MNPQLSKQGGVGVAVLRTLPGEAWGWWGVGGGGWERDQHSKPQFLIIVKPDRDNKETPQKPDFTEFPQLMPFFFLSYVLFSLLENRGFYWDSKCYNVHLTGARFCRAGSNLGGSRQECSSPIWAQREMLTAKTFFSFFFFCCSERKINIPESITWPGNLVLFFSLSLQVASNYVKQAQSDPWKNS